MSAREEFERLRAICESASGGEWSAGSDGVEGCFFVSGPRIPPYGVQSPHGITVMDAADADLIAESRSTLPAALACLTQLLEQSERGQDPGLANPGYNRAWRDVRQVIDHHFPDTRRDVT